MAGAPSSFLRHVHHLLIGHTPDRLTDHQLLERFAAGFTRPGEGKDLGDARIE